MSLLKSESDSATLNDWTGWGSALVSDALGVVGRPFQAMDGSIRPLADDLATAGPAFTVRCYPGATWAMEQALELADPGSVLVVDAGGRPDVIIMGGMMATRAASRELAGAIIDGAVRDVSDILATGLPVFSKRICPRAGTHAKIGEWQTTICCGRLPVSPGDWIVADQTGIVVVPQDILLEVAHQATLIALRERVMGEQLRQGASLDEAAEAARAAEME